MADDEPGRSSHIPEGLEATPGILALYEKYGARYPWWVILVSMTGAFATLLTGTIVNVAIPDIMGALGITIDQAQNIVTIFLAAGTVTMLMSPWCMRAFGIARTYVAALSVFAVSSALGGFATTGEAMVLARLVQGAAAGLVMPISMVLVAQVFPVHRRGMAMGVMSVGTVLAPALGPTIGGYLVDDLSWRWVFFIAIPFVAVSAPCATFLFPSREETGPKPSFDWTGAVLCSIFLVGLLTGLTEAQSEGWYDDRTLIPLAIGVAACALWILWETHAPEPMLDLRLLRHFGFVGAAIVTLTVGVGLYGSTYLFPLFLQQISMLIPTDSGLIMAPAGLAMAALFPLSGYLADRYSKRGIIAIGLVLVAWSSYLMKDADAFTPVATMVGWYVIGRVGLALIFPALNAAAINALPLELIPSGSGMINFLRQLGGAFGVNLISFALLARTTAHQAESLETQTWDNSGTMEMMRLVQEQFAYLGLVGYQSFEMSFSYVLAVVSSQGAMLGYRDSFVLVAAILLVSVLPAWMLRPEPKNQSAIAGKPQR